MAVDYVWRFVVTRLNGRILGILDRRSTGRKATFALGKAAFASGSVAADDPAVNLVQGDGFPILAEGVRNVYGLRKESGAWVCRFGGRLLTIEDNVEESQGAAPYSNWTAFDPRQLLYSRPVLNADGSLIGKNGLTYKAGDGVGAAQIALAFLQRSIDFQGDVGILTSGGTIETTLATDISFEQGTTVGEAWDQLEQGGYIDIILTPTYDTANPGALATLSIYEFAGVTKHKAIFAWDQPGRSLVGVNRLVDGTQRANKIRYYAGQGGPVADVGTVSDAASLATYGEYWAQQFFPASNVKGAVGTLAQEALLVKKNGLTTWRVTPAPAQSSVKAPVPFLGYNVADIVPIYVSNRFRQQASILQRVIEIPIDLRDDGTETVSQLSFSADGVGDENSDSTGDGGGGTGPPISPPPGGLVPYWEETFDGSYQAGLSQEVSAPQGGVPTGSVSYVPGFLGQAVLLSTPGQSSGSGGRLISIFAGASKAYSGYSGLGTLGQRMETFYRNLVCFGSAYQPAAGDWNWWLEWHNDTLTINELKNHGKPSTSCAIGVRGLGSASPTPVGPGTSPTFVVQMNGGPVSAPNYQKIYTGIAVPVDDDFHEVISHFVWDERSGSGFAEVIFDGVTLYSATRATLHTRDDGTLSYNTHGLYNYHLVSTHDIAIAFDEWRVGPDLTSVGG